MLSKRLDKHKHIKSGKYIKSFVYGGLDGTITTFAVVAGVAGASLNANVVLILGFANLVADGISMAVGDYLSTKAEREYGKSERKRELSMSMTKDKQKKYLAEIYKKQGFKKKEAESLAGIVCKNKDACADVMVSHELGIPMSDEDPIKNGATTFSSFLIFGFVPLLAYVLAQGSYFFENNTFFVASILTGITLFLLGASKFKLTGKNWFKSGIEMLLVGGIAAVVAFLIGKGVAGIV